MVVKFRDPSPEETRQAAEAIQETWSPIVEARRRGLNFDEARDEGHFERPSYRMSMNGGDLTVHSDDGMGTSDL